MLDPDTNTPVGMHFQERGHRGPEDCNIIPFVKVRSRDPNVRLILEKRAINELGLLEPGGLNKKLG